MNDDELEALAEKWIDVWGGNQINGISAILGALRELQTAHEKELAQMSEALNDLNAGAVETEKRLDEAERQLLLARACSPESTFLAPPNQPEPRRHRFVCDSDVVEQWCVTCGKPPGGDAHG